MSVPPVRFRRWLLWGTPLLMLVAGAGVPVWVTAAGFFVWGILGEIFLPAVPPGSFYRRVSFPRLAAVSAMGAGMLWIFTHAVLFLFGQDGALCAEQCACMGSIPITVAALRPISRFIVASRFHTGTLFPRSTKR